MTDALSVDTANAGFVAFPWAHDQTTIALPPVGYVCDPYSLSDDNILSFIRYSTVFWNSAAVAGNGDPFVFASGTILEAFSDGPGETNADTGKVAKGGGAVALTDAETNLQKQGAMVPQTASWFLCQAMGISFGAACDLTASGREYSSHISFYEERAVRALADLVFLSMQYEDTKITNDLGIARLWPAQSQVSNAQDVATLSTPMYGNMLPFTFPFFAGSRCACNLLNIFAELEEQISLDSDSNSATSEGDVLTIPMTVEIYGRVFCLDALRSALGGQVPSQFLDGGR